MNPLLRTLPPLSLPSDFSGFKTLLHYDAIEFHGVVSDHLYQYQVRQAENVRSIFLASMVLKEDVLAWQSFREMFEGILKMAASQMRGFYGLELIFFDLNEGFSSFHLGNLTQLLVNHSKKLESGNQMLVRYASLWMILSKRTHGDWGKIDFKSRVEIISKPDQLHLFLKKCLKDSETQLKSSSQPLFVISDLGQIPVFKFGSEDQTAKMARWLESFTKSNTPIPEMIIDHQKNWIEIGAQFGFRKEEDKS